MHPSQLTPRVPPTLISPTETTNIIAPPRVPAQIKSLPPRVAAPITAPRVDFRQPHHIPQTPQQSPEIRCTRTSATMIPADIEVPFYTDPQTNTSNLIGPNDELMPHRYSLRSQVNCVLDTTPCSPQQANAVLEEGSGGILEYRHLIKGPDRKIWKTSCANDFGRLAQGIGTQMPQGANTIFFIPRHQVPKGRNVSYVKPVATIQPNKAEVNCVRLTAGVGQIRLPRPNGY